MTRELALKQLFSSAAHDRLIAARFLARHAEPQDSEIISQALRQEDVLWTQTALRDALNRISAGRVTADQPAADATAQAKLTDEKEDITDQEIRDLYSRAVQESTSLLVHELEPILGALSVFAKLEISDFEQSRTKRHLDLFDALLSTISEFRKASTQPTYSEFDLAALIRDLAPNETTGSLA